MKIKKFVVAYGDIGYLILLLAIVILNIMYEIVFLSVWFHVSIYVIFYILAILGVYSFYCSNKPKGFVLLITVASTILLIGNPFIIIPTFLLLPILFKKRYHIVFRLLSGIVFVPVFLIMYITILFYNFGTTEVLEKNPSPDGKYYLLKIYHDQGALGGDIIINIEKNLGGILSIRKAIDIDGNPNNAEIDWVDNERIKVNGAIVKIQFSY